MLPPPHPPTPGPGPGKCSRETSPESEQGDCAICGSRAASSSGTQSVPLRSTFSLLEFRGRASGTQGGDARPAEEVLPQERCYSGNQKTWGWSKPAAQDSHSLPSGSPFMRRGPEATWMSGSLRDDGVTCKAWCLSAVLTTLSAAGEGGKDYGAR